MANVYFYPSKTHGGNQHYRYYPEAVSGRIMLNPRYVVSWFLPNTIALCDSGGFQDVHKRLDARQALDKQLWYEEYVRKIIAPDWRYEAFCTYDQMIGVDEQIINGKKVKKRGTAETALPAIEETLESAAYYKSRENELSRITYIAQGIDTEQYVYCTKQLIPMIRPGIDYFGFGGFCIIGKYTKSMLPLWYETCSAVLPLLAEAGVHRVHLLGVCIPRAVEFAVLECRKYGIDFSTDSSAPEMKANKFHTGYDPKTGKANIELGDARIDFVPAYEAVRNVRHYTEWINSI
mgnify:CR=1 FL=1